MRNCLGCPHNINMGRIVKNARLGQMSATDAYGNYVNPQTFYDTASASVENIWNDAVGVWNGIPGNNAVAQYFVEAGNEAKDLLNVATGSNAPMQSAEGQLTQAGAGVVSNAASAIGNAFSWLPWIAGGLVVFFLVKDNK